MTLAKRLVPVALVFLAAQSCRGTSLLGPCPARFVIKQGNNQEATAGTQLPTILIADWEFGPACPALDLSVQWEVISGGGSLAGVDISSSPGSTSVPRGQGKWTLGSALGTQTVRAVETTYAPHDTVVFTATARPPVSAPY